MRKFIAVAMILMLILVTGCSNAEYNNALDNPYSRESVNFRSRSCLFGTGRTEDIDVALKYLYDCKEISEIYGENFQMSGDKIVCYKSEGSSLFFLGVYSGEAVYEFLFDNSSYKISLSKKYFGKWVVDKCEKEQL